MGSINTLGYLLQHVASTMHRQSDQVLQERLGIGMSQFKILMILQYHPQAQQRMLAESLGQTEASISRQMKVLCDKGLLVVHVNPESRREHLAMPTAKGVKITEAAREILADYHGPVFNQFSEKQQKQLLELLEKMHSVACGSGKPHACGHLLDTQKEN